jgi:hypothetical protein
MCAIVNLSTRKLQCPFNGMDPAAALYFAAALRTRQRCKSAPQIEWPHVGDCPVGTELHEILKMGMVGDEIEVFESPVSFINGNTEIAPRGLRHCTLFHEHPPI